jgi:hypothetical protein
MMFRAKCLTAGLTIASLVAASALASTKSAPNIREVVAKVVAVNLQSKSIEADIDTGQSQIFPVVGKAAERLDQLPVGHIFTLTFQDSGDGTRHEVIAIKRAKNVPEK